MSFKIPEFLKKSTTYYIAGIPIILYVLLTVIPNTVGCLIPDQLCLDGVNKMGDILSISASLISIIFVLGAYEIWRKQKVAEILASEAKDLYKILDGISKSLDRLSSKINIIQSTEITSTDEYKNFKSLHEIVEKDLSLFKQLLEDENSTYVKDFNEFYNSYVDIDFDISKVDTYSTWPLVNKSVETTLTQFHKLITPHNIELFKGKLDEGYKILIKIILHKY